MFYINPDNLRNSCEDLQREIHLREEACEIINSAARNLGEMSSMEEQVAKLKMLLRAMEERISELCRIYSAIQEICYRSDMEERAILNNLEGIGNSNSSIIARQHIREILIPGVFRFE